MVIQKKTEVVKGIVTSECSQKKNIRLAPNRETLSFTPTFVNI